MCECVVWTNVAVRWLSRVGMHFFVSFFVCLDGRVDFADKKCGVGEVTVPSGTMDHRRHDGRVRRGFLPCTVVDNDRSKTRHCREERERVKEEEEGGRVLGKRRERWRMKEVEVRKR